RKFLENFPENIKILKRGVFQTEGGLTGEALIEWLGGRMHAVKINIPKELADELVGRSLLGDQLFQPEIFQAPIYIKSSLSVTTGNFPIRCMSMFSTGYCRAAGAILPSVNRVSKLK